MPACNPRITALVQQFDQAWRTGSGPPDILAFLPLRSDSTKGLSNRAALVSFVMIDLEHRWRRAATTAETVSFSPSVLPERPTLDDYVTAYPELGALAELPLELVCQEYRVRFRSGDRPNDLKYLSRFPGRTEELLAALAKLHAGDLQDVAAAGQTHEFVGSRDEGGDDCSLETPAMQTVGRYRVECVLGEGAFGTVFKGYDGQLKRHVAMKAPKEALRPKSSEIEAFLAEARKVANLDHPSIVTVFDLVRDPAGQVYIISKFVDGTDLAGCIKRRQLAWNESCEVLIGVADALHHAHKRGLVHRDVKPANILLDRAGRPYLTDFGLSLLDSERRNRVGEFAGTPAYMSPEQARTRIDQLDGRTDIWALGVILYELATGRRPFGGSTLAEVRQEVLNHDPKPLRQFNEQIPAAVDRICRTALQKSPNDRFSCAFDFAEALRATTRPSGRSPSGLQEFVRKSDPRNAAKHLATIPRGPMVDDSPRLRRLVDAFCELFPAYASARSVLEHAVHIRVEVDPDATVVKPYHVMGETGPVAGFWADVFREARKHGSRMVAALLLAVPREEFAQLAESAAVDWDTVLRELKAGRS